MTVCVCLDDQNGMVFNKRRQSRDRAVIADIVRTADGAEIAVAPYSAPLFEESGAALRIADEPLTDGVFCFAEFPPLAPYLDRVDTLIFYRWNRRYPADGVLDFDPAEQFTLTKTEEWAGYSHDTITKEVWHK